MDARMAGIGGAFPADAGHIPSGSLRPGRAALLRCGPLQNL